MKKKFSIVLALGIISSLTFGACGNSGSESSSSEPSETALFQEVEGTYDELFTVICDPQHDQLWLDDCAAIVGDEYAQTCAEMLKNACTGTVYGEEAVALYGDGSGGAQFDCYFINGIHQFRFEGNTIAGLDENGNEVFCHEYQDAGGFSIGGMMNGELYETLDADAGEFQYFLLLPDTPESTYHIEFRYGSSKDALAQYNEGPYAYWLAAGIPADCDQTMIENVIQLFCEENLSDFDPSQMEDAAA